MKLLPFLISPHYFEQFPPCSPVLVYGKIIGHVCSDAGQGVEGGKQTCKNISLRVEDK